MANYYTQFSCLLPVGSAANVAPALALYERLGEELDAADEVIGFTAEAAQGEGDEAASLWLHDDAGDGNPEHVIAFALRCAEAFGLTGRWGFVWGLGCSRPRLDGFGGGAHVLDLGRRETVTWVDCETWLAGWIAAGEARPAQAEPLLQSAAAAEPEGMLCRECGEPMLIAVEGTSHHVGCGMDGIDHGRDGDHVAIADGEVTPWPRS